jgi:hypothetical protein
MPEAISFEDAMKILGHARQSLDALAQGQAQRPGPWRPVGGDLGDNMPNVDQGNDELRPRKPTPNDSIDPGYHAGAPEVAPGWSGRPGFNALPVNLPKYGPHNPVLSEDQAHLLQLLWLVTGQNANTVGRGRVLQFAPVKAPPPAAEPDGTAGSMQARAE